jgi:lysophospholipase L1-like esterase
MKSIARVASFVLAAQFALTAICQTNLPGTDPRLAIPPTDDGLPGAGPIRRMDWFQKLWLTRRSAWEKQAAQDQHALVFLGDSITQGWGDDMHHDFPGVKVANRGISGDTTRGVLIRLDEDVLALHPKGVVLLIGTNDLEEKADPETIAANLKLIIAKLEASDAHLPIILCQVFPSSETKKRPADQIKKINALYAAAVKGDPRVTLVETWPLFANAQGDAKPEEFKDLLHPNDAGYEKWAGALHPILATLDFMDTTPDKFKPEHGFKSLFDGRDLTGWGYHATTPDELKSSQRPGAPAWLIVPKDISFKRKVVSYDGRYIAKNGRLIVATPPEYRKIQAIWTTRDLPNNFILKLEFRATPNADSGVFIRGPQLQCRDFLTAGPYKNLKHFKADDWNEMTITVKNGEALCLCNDEVLEPVMKVPEHGPLGLEGDRGQVEYRRIRVEKLD